MADFILIPMNGSCKSSALFTKPSDLQPELRNQGLVERVKLSQYNPKSFFLDSQNHVVQN